MSPNPEDQIPEGFNVDYSYYDEDDLCRRRGTADYVAEPITRESIEQRRREREDEQ
jgi:hypothetical protein